MLYYNILLNMQWIMEMNAADPMCLWKVSSLPVICRKAMMGRSPSNHIDYQ